MTNQVVDEITSFEKKVAKLLIIYDENRNAVMDMIKDLEKLKDKLDTIFPESADARYMRFFEDKVKAVSSFFNVLLDMRKEINKSIKDEIEIRRKTQNKDEKMDIEGLLDIRGATRKIENFQKAATRLKDKRSNKIKNIELPEGVGVPGVNAKTEGV